MCVNQPSPIPSSLPKTEESLEEASQSVALSSPLDVTDQKSFFHVLLDSRTLQSTLQLSREDAEGIPDCISVRGRI